MKVILTIIVLFISGTTFSQDNAVVGSDGSFPLNFEIMDVSHVRLLNKKINIDTCTFFASTTQAQVAYSLDKKKKAWVAVSLTGYDVDHDQINEIRKISMGIRGKSALIVEGSTSSYGSGGGGGVDWLEIIPMDSVPTCIFKITYGCWDESFGDRNNNSEGSYLDEYKRDVLILKNGISISILYKNAIPSGYTLTDIPEGTYFFKRGHLEKLGQKK